MNHHLARNYEAESKLCNVLKIQPSLTSAGFDPKVLLKGTPDEQQFQLDEWQYGKNPSVFVQWVPDEMTPEMAVHTFSPFGPVDRIEFVPKFNDDRKQIGRMMFVHFKEFFGTNFEARIVNAYPNPHELNFEVMRSRKNYILKCRVNTRPIPKVEYSTSQLTDMFENLNSRVVSQMAEMQKQLDACMAENRELRARLDQNKIDEVLTEVFGSNESA